MDRKLVLKSLNKQSHLHPILAEYFRTKKPETNTLFVCNCTDNEINKIVTFQNGAWRKILAIQFIRSSYNETTPSPFLYEIIYRPFQAPELYLYTFRHGVLRLLFILNMTEIAEGIYESFVDTPVKITLELAQTPSQSLCILKNAQDDVILYETSASTIQDPVEQFIAYLDSAFNIDLLLFELLDKMCTSKSLREKAKKRLSKTPKIYEHLFLLRYKLYIHDAPFEQKKFIEEIFAKSFGFNLLAAKEFQPGASLFTLQKNEVSYELLVTKTPQDCEVMHTEYILEEKQDFTREHTQTVTYSYLKDGRLFYDTYDKDTTHPRPLHRLHYYFYELFEMQRFSQFTLVQEYDRATSPHIIIRASCQKDDIRLIGCTVATNQSVAEDLNLLISEMQQEKMPYFNRILIHMVDSLEKDPETLINSMRTALRRARVEKIFIQYMADKNAHLLEVKNILGEKLKIQEVSPQPVKLISPLSKIERREVQILSKGGIWAYRIPLLIDALSTEFREKELGLQTPAQYAGFIELDLDHSKTVIHPTTGSIDYNFGELIPIERPIGHNEAGVVIGIKTDDLGLGHPVRRLLILGDLSHSSRGAIRNQECVRINAAIRYAAKEGIPIDWYAASYGVQIHRERGVEGLDAAASTLREIVDNCHHKGLQINFIIDEANIGAQSYWDSMAAIMHDTTGIIIMTSNGCMALTGPKALACALYSTIPSEQIGKYTDDLYPHGLQSLSGHELVHGPNSDSMLFANSLEEASRMLLLHHYYGYVKRAEPLASKRLTALEYMPGIVEQESLQKEMDNFLKGLKPNRKSILGYLKDFNSPAELQFWQDAKGIQKQQPQNGDLPQEASTIVEEILIGGYPTLVIFTPTGPLTPADANIISRAIYKVNKRMQVLIIGSLSGFSCDPLSMENRQLLEGAFIAKAIVEHSGPIIICNLGSLVGGTFAVFNKQLNKDLRILAIEGARVQVIGGKSAAKVVFHSSICKQADQDDRIVQAMQKVANNQTKSPQDVRSRVISEIEDHEGVLFDKFHNAQRAMKVKSIDQIISFSSLKEAIISNFEELRVIYLHNLSQKDHDLESAA